MSFPPKIFVWKTLDGMEKTRKKRQVKHLLQSVYRLQAPTHDC